MTRKETKQQRVQAILGADEGLCFRKLEKAIASKFVDAVRREPSRARGG